MLPVQQTILRLVNEKNTLVREITDENVIMGLPEAIPIDSDPKLIYRNTKLQLDAIVNKGYYNVTDVFYRRFDLASLFTGIDPDHRDVSPTLENLLEGINTRYGLHLRVEDVGNPEEFPEWDPEDREVFKTYELRITDPNYEWTGTVSIEIVQGNPLLSSVVSVQLLPLLKHPDDPEILGNRQSGTAMTWAFDFTPWKDQLVIDTKWPRHWLTFADILDIGGYAGLRPWRNGRVVDMPTSAVPASNPKFERVMVQNYAGGGVVGPLYFHYDVNW